MNVVCRCLAKCSDDLGYSRWQVSLGVVYRGLARCSGGLEDFASRRLTALPSSRAGSSSAFLWEGFVGILNWNLQFEMEFSEVGLSRWIGPLCD